MSLETEINDKTREIYTDSYPMSIGEIISIYKSGELNINPIFQRLFKWDIEQKSKFIESILLGIPIPPIFVSQRKDGVWDIIDGLQRLSTIYEFVGVLNKPDGKKYDPSKLVGTHFLPSLNNKYWQNDEDPENSFTPNQRIDFKRSKLNINIIKKQSDSDVKYDMFQRLNSGGTILTPQELRNCIILSESQEFFDFVSNLAVYPAFETCISLSDSLIESFYNYELVLRWLIAHNIDLDSVKGTEDIHNYITERILDLIQKNIDLEQERDLFTKTFDYLNNLLGENIFKKYNNDKDKFMGGFSLSLFEVIASPISNNINNLPDNDYVLSAIKSLPEKANFKSATNRGIRPIRRYKLLNILGLELFKNED